MPEEDYINQEQDPEIDGENINEKENELEKETDAEGSAQENEKDEAEMQEELEQDKFAEIQAIQEGEVQENQGSKLSDTVGNIADIAKDQLKKKGWQIVLRSPYFWGAIAIILGVLMVIAFIYVLVADPCFSLNLFGFSLSGAACDVVQSLTS